MINDTGIVGGRDGKVTLRKEAIVGDGGATVGGEGKITGGSVTTEGVGALLKTLGRLKRGTLGSF